MKHAFLIMAHNNINILNMMLHLLDNPNNDIYIHIDKKTKHFDIWKGNKSYIYVFKTRFDVRWATSDQIKLELYMLSEALLHNTYSYYHFLSGVDMPLKSNSFIHDFFSQNKGKEFVGFVPIKTMDKEIFKVLNYHFFTRNLKNKESICTKIHWKLIDFQINHNISRKQKHEYRKGSNWVSITHDFAKYLIDRKDKIIKEYRFTFGCDEIFLQTELWNSPYKKNIYDIDDEFHSSVRKIDWNRGNPYIWTEDDFEELISSDAIFARKFDSIHFSIVRLIYERISKENNNY